MKAKTHFNLEGARICESFFFRGATGAKKLFAQEPPKINFDILIIFFQTFANENNFLIY